MLSREWKVKCYKAGIHYQFHYQFLWAKDNGVIR